VNKTQTLSVIVFIASLVCFGTAIFNWSWAMRSDEAKPVVDLVGRRNARLFYALLGAGFLAVGILMLSGVLKLPAKE
jgi:hypothetical protein